MCLLSSPHSQNGLDPANTFGEPLKHVITLRGQILVSRKFAIRDGPNVRLRCSRNVKKALVSPMKNTRLTTTPPPSPSTVYTFKTSSCMPAPRAHVDPRFFSVSHTTPQPTTTTRPPHHTETETNRDRERQRKKTEKEDRDKERRGDEREEHKTTEENTRPKQEWEPQLPEDRYEGHHSRTCHWLDFCRGTSIQPRNRHMPDNLADEAPALALPRRDVLQGQAVRNVCVFKSDVAKHVATLGCKSVFVRLYPEEPTECVTQ